jgi:hypothetical protein
MPNAFEWVQAVASVATAGGVLLAWWQLLTTKRIAATEFEDQLTTQYREIVRALPIEALLGEQLSEEAHVRALPNFYYYFDLSNEQAFLYRARRIQPHTWNDWLEGIHENLRRPAFAKAWAEVSRRAPDTFDDLRSVVEAPRRLSAHVAPDMPKRAATTSNLSTGSNSLAATLPRVHNPKTVAPASASRASKKDLSKWLHEALLALAGRGGLAEVARYIWDHHELDLRASGTLFYTWQYDLRWAANRLRRAKIMRDAEESPRGVWELRK